MPSRSLALCWLNGTCWIASLPASGFPTTLPGTPFVWTRVTTVTIDKEEADLAALADLVAGGTISDIGHHRLCRLGLITPQAPHTNIGLEHLTTHGAALLIAQANHGA